MSSKKIASACFSRNHSLEIDTRKNDQVQQNGLQVNIVHASPTVRNYELRGLGILRHTPNFTELASFIQ